MDAGNRAAQRNGTVRSSKSGHSAFARPQSVFSSTAREPAPAQYGNGGGSSSRGASTQAPAGPSEKTVKKPRIRERNHAKHAGANRFFFCGRLLTSGANPLPFLGCLLLMIAIPGLWFGFVAPYIWRGFSPALVIIFAYLFLVALVNMLVTATSDPGILPRNLDPDPPCTVGETAPLDPEDPLAVPLPRIIRVRESDIKVKWCETCGTYRAPRSSHCRPCDNCVEDIDHHCTFLNNCIGRRNYASFFAFLVFCVLAGFWILALCVVHLYYLTRPTTYELPRKGHFGGGHDFKGALAKAPVTAVLFCVTLVSLAPIGTLLGYHVWLVMMNRTTVEQIRINTAREYGEKPGSQIHPEDRPQRSVLSKMCCTSSCHDMGLAGIDPNPFASRSPWRNLLGSLGRPRSFSWIEPSRYVTYDNRLENPATTAERLRAQTAQIRIGSGDGGAQQRTYLGRPYSPTGPRLGHKTSSHNALSDDGMQSSYEERGVSVSRQASGATLSTMLHSKMMH
ncbi:Eukaryotic peptide chain release factor GTP-binding subunit [Tilletia horrida]|uniref:Palmitoyltransferase n=1 Tax=Tilletia horrida TaxID=155126 RepID=A0AAN6GAB8_9BASI|nr:Eukaryotic peptide chain release factor GTP-binding subunit [Tilletia horrida]